MYYKEKKLNISKAIRKQVFIMYSIPMYLVYTVLFHRVASTQRQIKVSGFCWPIASLNHIAMLHTSAWWFVNTAKHNYIHYYTCFLEYVNGQRMLYQSTDGYLMAQKNGAWVMEEPTPFCQPAKVNSRCIGDWCHVNVWHVTFAICEKVPLFSLALLPGLTSHDDGCTQHRPLPPGIYIHILFLKCVFVHILSLILYTVCSDSSLLLSYSTFLCSSVRASPSWPWATVLRDGGGHCWDSHGTSTTTHSLTHRGRTSN